MNFAHPKARRTALAGAALACLCMLPAGASAGEGGPFPQSRLPTSGYDRGPGPQASQPVDLDGAPAQAHTVRVGLNGGATARTLALPRGKSAVIELPVDARDVLVSDPKTADVVLSTPRRIYIMGLAAGQTDAVFVDGNGRQILRLDIRVDQDVSALGQ